jgi:hypothetical protein
MQYAAHLPNTRAMLAPVVALAIGAAGATGVYALVDDNAGSVEPAAIVISEPAQAPAATGPNEAGVAAAVSSTPAFRTATGPNEAGVAAAVSSTPAFASSSGKDESTTAAAVGGPAFSPSGSGEPAPSSVIGGAH